MSMESAHEALNELIRLAVSTSAAAKEAGIVRSHVMAQDFEIMRLREAIPKFSDRNTTVLRWRIAEVQAKCEALQARIDAGPAAIMDTRDALGICAPTEEDFPAIYALQGKRVRLVVE